MPNCRPRIEIEVDTKTGVASQTTSTIPGIASNSGSGTVTYNYIKTAYNEVRPPTGKDGIINGSKQEKLKDSSIKVPNGTEDADGNVQYDTITYRQQEYSAEDPPAPLFERTCKADISYDEKYFYHIFHWPSTHTLLSSFTKDGVTYNRVVGGIVKDVSSRTDVITTTNSEGVSSTTTQSATTTTRSLLSYNVSATFTLGKTVSQIQSLPEGSVAYHAGTDDNAILFFYNNTTDRVIAVGDTVNGWTITKIINYNSIHKNNITVQTSQSLRKYVSSHSGINVSPAFIYINNNNESEGVVVTAGDEVYGTGVATGTKVESIEGLKINLTKPLTGSSVKEVTFTNNSKANSVSNEVLCYAEISGGSSNFTADANYEINGLPAPDPVSTVYHVFNDDSNVTLQLSTTNKITVTPQSESDPGGGGETSNRKHYLVKFEDGTTIASANDVSITITDNQTGSGYPFTMSVAKVEYVNSTSFKVWFKRNDNSDNGYVRGWSVTRNTASSTSGNTIKVVAGKGIITRSAVCGVFAAKNKKFIQYKALFYGKDAFCEVSRYKDSNGEYVLANATLDDGSFYLEEKFLCVKPISDTGYKINNIFWTYFNRPAERDELAEWLDQAEQDNNILITQDNIIKSETTRLNGKTIISVKDVECGNPITIDYTKVYYPDLEISEFKNTTSPIADNPIYDKCVSEKGTDALNSDLLKKSINSAVENAFNFSSINLPEEMYKQIVSNEDSLQNRLFNAIETVSSAVPITTQIPNSPPKIEGEDKSSRKFLVESFHYVPPRVKSLEYVLADFYLKSDAELDPNSTVNNAEVIIKSIPKWTGSPTVGGTTGDSIVLSGLTVTTNKTDGFIDSITVASSDFTPQSTPIPGFTVVPSRSWDPGPLPTTIWGGDDVNYQATYKKILNFRVAEVSTYVAESLKNKGNPFLTYPVYAKLEENLTNGATTIKVDSTDNFLSSGYLIIPKFIIKTEINPETRNETVNHYYVGEEIIYYKKKTATEFQNCTREMFDTVSTFDISVNSGQILEGVMYEIKTLGSIDWTSYGAPSNAAVGTIFTATKNGSQTSETGEVYLFETRMTPFESSPDLLPSINSFEKGNYLAQYWPIKIQNKSV